MRRGRAPRQTGFTLVELVMIMLLLALISTAVAVKWPTDMGPQAARLEFQRAVRYAQHMALTREWTTSSGSWGIIVAGNKYYVGRANVDCVSSCANPGCAEESMCNRSLLGDPGITLTSGGGGATVLFNGLGEPIDNTGGLLANTTFTIDGSKQLTVCAQTGYVLDGGGCP
jgi:type II secretory pathway pseudopilin PulG